MWKLYDLLRIINLMMALIKRAPHEDTTCGALAPFKGRFATFVYSLFHSLNPHEGIGRDRVGVRDPGLCFGNSHHRFHNVNDARRMALFGDFAVGSGSHVTDLLCGFGILRVQLREQRIDAGDLSAVILDPLDDRQIPHHRTRR